MLGAVFAESKELQTVVTYILERGSFERITCELLNVTGVIFADAYVLNSLAVGANQVVVVVTALELVELGLFVQVESTHNAALYEFVECSVHGCGVCIEFVGDLLWSQWLVCFLEKRNQVNACLCGAQSVIT